MYQVIARKYRPQHFGELIGQEHVQKTLANAIEGHRLAHGYIFSGQRGTGKTTVARILARCLNCIQGPTATPCGICSSCTEISAGNSPDVIEIDAASNRGINEMREIRENVRYRPARDKYKVFIVDEAHQITKEAFNALLKTLEEPPEWVVFILCTTEANEIPNTIASRCQQFTFRSVDFTELIKRMKWIADQEGIETSDEVLSVIAQAGEGSVRDSLSALDQAIACCGMKLNVEQIRALLGMFGADSLRAIAEAVDTQDSGRMLDIVDELKRNGQSLQHFSRELSRYWRNLLVVRIAGKPSRLIDASEREQLALLETASLFSEEDLTRYLNLTLDLYKALQTSLQPRLHLELGLLKLVQAGKLQSIEEALAGLGKTNRPAKAATAATGLSPAAESPSPVARGSLIPSARTSVPRPPALLQPAKATPAATATPEIVAPHVEIIREAPPEPEAPPEAVSFTPQPASSSPESKIPDLRQDLHDALCEAGMNHSADAVQHAEVRLEGADLVIRAPKAVMLLLKDPNVERIAAQVLRKPVRVRLEAGENIASVPLSVTAKAVGEDNNLRERALSHPGIKRFQELFPDAQVRTVRNLK